MEELQLHLHSAHEADHEKSPKKHSQQVRETYRDINEHMIGKVLYTQPLIRALMNLCSIWNRSVSVLSLQLQPIKSYDLIPESCMKKGKW